MTAEPSRRSFLLAGLALPAALETNLNPLQQKLETPLRLQYRNLGRTGLKPTSVAFGCMITSDPSVIERAADLGINYFDTARGYQNGNNERMVGAALKAKRKDLILSTKTGAKTKEEALQHIDTSLKELGTDYVDIWHLHGKARPEELTDDLLEAQQIAQKAGKARFLGVSTHMGQPELFLTAYNFTMEPGMDAVIESATKAGLGIIAMKVMAGGSRMAKPGTKQYEVYKRDGAMLAALKWVLKNPNVQTAIPSITDMEQLDENMRAFSEPFTETDQKTLTARLREIRPLYCSMCGACNGKCPKGVPIADVLRYLSYSEGYGEYQLGRENFLSLPAEIRGVRCADCASCAVRCPNGVRVADRLRTAQEIFA
jgi:predicted aldo/keto reductase-like oxidoreductase